MAVLLPAPLGPIRPVIWPSAAVNEHAVDRLHAAEVLVQILHLEQRGHAAPVSSVGPVTAVSTATAAPPFPAGSLSRKRRSGRMPCGRKRMNSTRTTPVMISRKRRSEAGLVGDLGQVAGGLLQPHHHDRDAEDDAAGAAPATDEDRGVEDDRLHR